MEKKFEYLGKLTDKNVEITGFKIKKSFRIPKL